jgi:hypothetical protein
VGVLIGSLPLCVRPLLTTKVWEAAADICVVQDGSTFLQPHYLPTTTPSWGDTQVQTALGRVPVRYCTIV